jgi:hypothetical protein
MAYRRCGRSLPYFTTSWRFADGCGRPLQRGKGYMGAAAHPGGNEQRTFNLSVIVMSADKRLLEKCQTIR